jgi:hypothetical protein
MSEARAAGRWIFALAVLASVVSAGVAAANTDWEAALRFTGVAVIMLYLRSASVPAPFAGAFAVFLFLATWASARHWYRELDHIDLVVHYLTPGSLAAAAYFVLVEHRWLDAADAARAAALRNAAPVLWVTMLGTTVAVLWEFYEWGMEQLTPATMLVGYSDTIGDLLAGFLGSVTAGVLVLRWSTGITVRPATGQDALR